MKHPASTVPWDRLPVALLALALCTTSGAVAQTAPANSTAATDDESPVVLSPFTVNTTKDKGYAATNAISGSRVDTAIKDIPIPMQVITSDFISDTGATDLRKSLAYVSGITLQSQNDLENNGGIGGIQTGAYGPGGVNNPEGVTSNISGTQLKIRGFITNNVLRDGFLRASPSDAINIERIEVVQGPNALLYGTGNFGGVVDYLTKRPQDKQQGSATVGYGMNNYKRATLDVTGPLLDKQHLDYRFVGSWEDYQTDIDWQRSKHYFISPSLSWKPFELTEIFVSTEYTNQKNNGFGFRALRAARGTGATPINNDQLEATSFYFPPGADKRTWNLSGPDTFNNQDQRNLEVIVTQGLLKESTWLPRVDFLVGYNHADWRFHTRDVAGGIQQLSADTNPGWNLSQTITLSAIDNGLDGVTPSNGNLQYGTYDHEVVRYNWNGANQKTIQNQERIELTAKKSLFPNSWFRLEDQVLAGYSELYNETTRDSWQTLDNLYSFKGPLDLAPIHYATQGDGSPAPGIYQNDRDNINKGWDKAVYINNFLKFGKLMGVEDRIILMGGLRQDTNDKWSTDTTLTSGGVGTTITSVAKQGKNQSKQYGIMVKLTDSLSLFGLKADGFQPNFGGLHDALTGAPVGADTAQSKEWGIKFDFLKGKISGSISQYKITKTAWQQSGFSSPAPLGHPKFDPTKPVVYALKDANSAFYYNPWTNTSYQTKDDNGNVITKVGFTDIGENYAGSPEKTAAWKAGIDAGAITLTSPINGQSANHGLVYVNASTPEGAAYMDEIFKTAAGPAGWAGWIYGGNDGFQGQVDPGINNTTLDDAAFQNGSQNAAIQKVSEAEGVDASIVITPNDQFQVVLAGSFNQSVRYVDLGKWIKYQYGYNVDRWATWYFPNGGFGLKGQTLAAAYTDPNDTSTRTNTGVFPGDDTPHTRLTAFANYKFEGSLKGWIVGLGGDWASKRAYFSGVTHGSQQVQTDSAGIPIVLYMPSQLKLNGFVRREWKAYGYNQSVQLNVDNILNDTKLYGLIYNPPITAKMTYQISF